MRSKTSKAAHGKWPAILQHLAGLDEKQLSGKHAHCPMCTGKRSFRFDDKDGEGGWICSHCGAGKGFKLLQAVTGWDFSKAAAEVDQIVGNLQAAPVRTGPTDEEIVQALRRVQNLRRPITPDGPVAAYLRGRGLEVNPTLAQALLYDIDSGQKWPTMVAKFVNAEGKPVTWHRTFLTQDGQKAPIESPRKVMTCLGEMNGGAVRLAPAGPLMGVAEGIETAMSASILFGIPVWATLNAGMMECWQPPPQCQEVVVFGDNDANYTGQAAAFGLAKRLSLRKNPLKVQVEIPAKVGADWSDVLLDKRKL
jgi:putative DNA primase/helicase